MARHVVRNGSQNDRAALATRSDLAPEWLVVLAADSHPDVREAVAANSATPAQVDKILAHDPNEQVRVVLAGKIAALSPHMPHDIHVRLESMAWQTLSQLVQDTAARVRAAIADVVKSMPDAPHTLIVALANDTDMSVADPVIRLSPLLSDDDLLTLISNSSTAVNIAVANRVDLGAAISDALVETQDVTVITELLNNTSAAIREETLDGLIGQAAQRLCWQKPLANRPFLSPRAARALSDVVTEEVLHLLAERTDLDHDVSEEIRQRLNVQNDAIAEAAEETCNGKLEAQVMASIHLGERQRLVNVLAKAAHVPSSAVEYAASLRSAKSLVALCWHAGFSMKIATALQSVLGRLSPDAILKPAPNGSYPLLASEMRWQIDFLLRREQ